MNNITDRTNLNQNNNNETEIKEYTLNRCKTTKSDILYFLLSLLAVIGCYQLGYLIGKIAIHIKY